MQPEVIELDEPQRAAVAVVQRDSLVRVDPSSGIAWLHHDGAAPQLIRERIERLKDFLMTLPGRLDLTVKHEVCDGMYLRKLLIPAGTLLIGKVHLKPCHNIVARGEISVLTEQGCARVGAGYTGMSSPGSQKVGLAHTDVLFINVFRTEKTELADIEAEIACEANPADRMEAVCL